MEREIHFNTGEIKNLTMAQLKTFRDVIDAAISLKEKDGKEVLNEEVAPSRKDFEESRVKYSSEDIMAAIRQVGNGPLWDKAKKLSEKEYGQIRWPFVMYVYEKLGGKK